MNQESISFKVSFQGYINLLNKSVFNNRYECVIAVPDDVIIAEPIEAINQNSVKKYLMQQARELYLLEVEKFVLSSMKEDNTLGRPLTHLARKLYISNWSEEVILTNIALAH